MISAGSAPGGDGVLKPQQQEQESLSSVKISMNAKGMAQPEVKVYEGVTREEMQRLLDLAVETFETTVTRLGARANFS